MRSPASTGRLLGSVSLRYHAPICPCSLRPPRRLGFGGSRWRPSVSRDPCEGELHAQDGRITRLEAVFFLSQQPQTSRKLAQLAGLADGTKARTLVRTLNQRYDAEQSAFRIEEVAGGYQLLTRSKFAPWLRRLHATPTEIRLSAPGMETLAVVAYRQPVLRAEIEAIRGVQSGEVLRQLIERDLVRIVGRSDELGRPFLYGTTRLFLQTFGLRRLDELPRSDALRTPETSAIHHSNSPESSDTDTISPSLQSQAAGEETNVKTLMNTRPRREALAEQRGAVVVEPLHDDRFGHQAVAGKSEEEDDDLEDDLEDDEDEDDEDLDDEPWEEVDDEDDLEEEEEDDDWDDEDEEDWEEDDDDWDDDEDDWEDDEEEEEDEEPED
jgi:segregation and condensation protein B